MKLTIKKGFIISVLFLILGYFLFVPGLIQAQKYTHIVQKGDTLWDICEKYYGNPDLWPELWEMNPFITNPHLLEPGDVITLFEDIPPRMIQEPEVEEPQVEEEEPEKPTLGINLEGYTDFNTIGFLTLGTAPSEGRIIAANNNKIILSKGDIAYVLFEKPDSVKIGDEYNIGLFSPLLKHPVMEKKLGHTFSINGRLVVEDRSVQAMQFGKYYNRDDIFQARITEIYEPVSIDDAVMPVQQVSPCVLPVEYGDELLANIVASKLQKTLISSHSIVYLDLGFNQGVNRGNVFQIVRPQVIDDPAPDKEKPWEPISKIILPDIPLGMIIVLESRPDTSAALVLKCTEELRIGSYIKDMPWSEANEYLSTTKETCSLE